MVRGSEELGLRAPATLGGEAARAIGREQRGNREAAAPPQTPAARPGLGFRDEPRRGRQVTPSAFLRSEAEVVGAQPLYGAAACMRMRRAERGEGCGQNPRTF
ncbi:hypothetical protein GUJ93_ZPchr0012g20817 [Zizania palustris]|uniref:Uncharacterized protein n=1 Tax=Zizania palustris TaxID=103762 RepID=A0A8J5WP24_ZIZPA|nr:hypothetical protein GUJ93_ZPchr0012g21748 [Zizania palustris]KAG8094942.1 hypothetical protein GUJ93_ZPchr0012g20817 [Zizania palustris]